MARRLVIDVEANIAGTQRVLTTLSNQLTALRHQADTISGIENRVAGKALGQQQGTSGIGDPRPYISQVQTSYQQFGNTVKQVSTWVKELNGSLITGTTTTYGGSLERILAAQEAYRIELEKAAPIEDRATAKIAKLNVSINEQALAWEHLEKAQYRVGKGPGGTLNVRDANTGQIVKGDAAQFLQASGIYERAQQRIAKLNLPAFANALEAERNATPPLPDNFRQIATGSPDLLRTLTKAGVAGSGGTAGLYETGAAQSFKVQEDLVRQVTRVTGSYTDQFGVLKRINAEYDRSGNITTTFGGRLRNLGSAINQTGRDILKMGEWAIAAVAVYSAFNQIGQSIGVILTVDKQLHQLGITANLTNAQTDKLRDSLAQVAIDTATPLTELLSSADNVALAVRHVGDTAEETESKIVSFSRSVGVLTNLSGIDTVKATDLLTSAYKQLGLTVDQIPSLLDKVTAAAGGQSNAIADIITAVAQLGEAAKVGNLSISDLVGTVQVLSQVTAKSPAEVATSLKNLIGSIGSPGSIKALHTYGIELHDTQGNLKSVLQIYGEIQQKFQNGVIPEGAQQALIRAISGGPRRAPDAAALLGNYNQIAAAIQTASNASNESTIANLKVLDSAQAKLVQLQATFDRFTTGKFGQIVRESVGNISELLTKVLDVLDKLDPSVYGFIGGAVLVTVVTKALAFGFNSIGGVIIKVAEDMGILNRAAIAQSEAFINEAKTGEIAAQSIRQVGNAAQVASGQMTAFNSQQLAGARGGALGGLGSAFTRNKGNLTTIGAGVATGAALDIATGADPKTFLQNLLLGGGIAALTVPEPTGLTKLIGLLGIGGGALLTFVGNEKKADTAAHATTEELLQSVTAYQQAADQITAIAKDNDALGVSMDKLLSKQKLNAQGQQDLASKQQAYAQNVLKQIEANVQLQESFDVLKKNIEEISTLTDGERSQLKIQIDAAINGQLAPGTLKELQQKITQQFLQQADPEKYKNVTDFTFKVPVQLDIQATINETQARDSIQQQIENSLNHGVPLTTGNINPNINPTLAEEVTRMAKAAGLSTEGFIDEYNSQIANLKQLVAQYSQVLDPAQKYENILKQIDVDKQALVSEGLLHIIPADEVDQGSKLLDLLKRVVEIRQQFQPNIPAGTRPDRADDVAKQQTDQANTDVQTVTTLVFAAQAQQFKLTKDQAIQLGDAYLRLSGKLQDVGKYNDELQAIDQLFKGMGIDVKILTDNLNTANIALQKFQEDQRKGRQDIRQGYISEVNDLISQRTKIEGQLLGEANTPIDTSGDAKQVAKDRAAQNARIKGYTEQLSQVNALISLNAKLRTSLLGINAALGTKGLDEFKNSLSSVHGLEGLVYTDNTNLASSLVQIAQQFGLTGDQVVELSKKLTVLAGIVKALDQLKATVKIDVQIATTQLQTGQFAGSDEARLLNQARGIRPGETTAHQTENDFQKSINDLLNGITKLFGSGKGSSLGSTKAPGGAGAGSTKSPVEPNVSLLDYSPDLLQAEKLGLTTQPADVRTIIANAKKLQAQIPGETKKDKNDIVEILNGTKKIAEVRGISEELLRKSMDELAGIEKARLEFDTKADQIRRIRVGSGDFAAIANVPFNSTSGVSVGTPNDITININGAGLTPAQYAVFADRVASEIKRSIAAGQ